MRKMINDMFEAIDRKDAEGFTEFLSDSAAFRFGNQPAVHGREAIQNTVSVFFSAVHGLKHSISNIWEVDGAIICEGDVSYERHDGKKLAFPFANILRMKGKQVEDYRIFADVSPLFT